MKNIFWIAILLFTLSACSRSSPTLESQAPIYSEREAKTDEDWEREAAEAGMTVDELKSYGNIDYSEPEVWYENGKERSSKVTYDTFLSFELDVDSDIASGLIGSEPEILFLSKSEKIYKDNVELVATFYGATDSEKIIVWVSNGYAIGYNQSGLIYLDTHLTRRKIDNIKKGMNIEEAERILGQKGILRMVLSHGNGSVKYIYSWGKAETLYNTSNQDLSLILDANGTVQIIFPPDEFK